MGDPALPPSRFGAGHTMGGPVGLSPAPATSSDHRVSGPEAAVSGAGLAAGALILALLMGPLGSPIAVPMAYTARRRIASSSPQAAGLAKAAIFVGYAYLVLGLVVLLMYVGFGGSPDVSGM